MENFTKELQQMWVVIIQYIQKQGFAVFLLCCGLLFLWRQSEYYAAENQRLRDEERARWLILSQQLQQENSELKSLLNDCTETRVKQEIELARIQALNKKYRQR